MLTISSTRVALIYLAIGVAVMRKMIFAYGTLGHNWDWSIPPTAEGLVRYGQSLSYTWTPISLGFAGTQISPLQMLLGLTGFLGLDGNLVSKIVVLLTFAVSGLSMYLLTTYAMRGLTTEPHSRSVVFGSFLAGYFYAFSPFLFNDIIGGAITQFVTYAIFPLVLLLYGRSLDSSVFDRNAVFAAMALTAVSISLQSLVLSFSVILVYTVFRGSRFRRLLQVMTLWAAFNAYWLLSEVYAYDVITKRYGSVYFDPSGGFLNLTIHAPTLLEAFYGTGYWFSFFANSIPASTLVLWVIAATGLLVITFSFSLLQRKNSAIFWVILFIASISVATGMNGPLRPIIALILYSPNPFTLLFSGNPQRLVSPSILALSVLIGIASHSHIQYIRSKFNSRLMTGILATVLLISVSTWIGPFYSGNLGSNIDNFKAPPWYNEMSSLVANSTGEGARLLYLPMAHSPMYLGTAYQAGGFQGGDPLVDTSPLPTITTDLLPNPTSRQLSYSLLNLIYGDFHKFYPAQNSNITLESTNPSSVNVRVINKLPDSAILKINLYDLNRFVPGTVNGFLTLNVNDGHTSVAGSSHDILLMAKQLEGFVPGDILQAALIREDGSLLELSNELILGYTLPTSPSLANLLSFFNIKYVVLRNDVAPNFGPFSPNGPDLLGLSGQLWNYSRAYAVVSDARDVELIKDWGTASLWVNRQYRPTLIYPAIELRAWNDTGSSPDAAIFNALSALVLGHSFVVGKSAFFMESQKDMWGTYVMGASRNLGENVSLNFIRINPTKFMIKVNSDGPFFLVLTENFDQRWHAFFGDPGELFASFSNAVPESSHLVANGFANAWYIGKKGDYVITLYYITQSIVDLGVIVSVVSLFTAVGCLLLSWATKRVRQLRSYPVNSILAVAHNLPNEAKPD